MIDLSPTHNRPQEEREKEKKTKKKKEKTKKKGQSIGGPSVLHPIVPATAAGFAPPLPPRVFGSHIPFRGRTGRWGACRCVLPVATSTLWRPVSPPSFWGTSLTAPHVGPGSTWPRRGHTTGPYRRSTFNRAHVWLGFLKPRLRGGDPNAAARS